MVSMLWGLESRTYEVDLDSRTIIYYYWLAKGLIYGLNSYLLVLYRHNIRWLYIDCLSIVLILCIQASIASISSAFCSFPLVYCYILTPKILLLLWGEEKHFSFPVTVKCISNWQQFALGHPEATQWWFELWLAMAIYLRYFHWSNRFTVTFLYVWAMIVKKKSYNTKKILISLHMPPYIMC